MIFVILLLVIIAGVFDAMNEALKHNYTYAASKFKFFKKKPTFYNPSISHRNKWKTNSFGDVLIPRQERFLFSSTLLVLFTDAYHLYRHRVKLSLTAAILIAPIVNWEYWASAFGLEYTTFLIVWSVVIFLVHYLVFHFLYNYLHKT